MKPIERMILKVFQVPENEHEPILETVGADYSQPKVSKKGVMAWALLNVYDESPSLIFAGIFTVFFVVPFLFFLNIFSS
jgi:hypothetical protein